ncbi:MAG: argininosuccinate lyase [Anaerolineaceae bacterium]|nr:argininosuccinate lyase [Anaerolineaceae bacterium]
MTLWGGRFSEELNELMKQFNDSFQFDKRLYAVDIEGSLAYADALCKIGLLSMAENSEIQKGLIKVRNEFDSGQFEDQPGDEDIHTAVERRLKEIIGEPAGKLHTGRSRNDQVGLDMRLFLMSEIEKVSILLSDIQKEIINKAEKHIEVIMPGFTHLQPAQPILFSHWIMRFFWMFQRDRSRLKDALKRTSISPLGSGALAGNPFPIDREAIAETLGMESVSMNSLDAVSDRDFVAEFLFVLSMVAVHVSQYAEDMILFCNPALGFLKIGESFSTGSSLMPQKRNPDSLELARGKSGRIISALVNLLIVLKGLPSTYNKDLQEDKEVLFDSLDQIKIILSVLSGVIESIKIFPENMEKQLSIEMLATDMADYLVDHGVAFREAHQIIGKIIQYGENNHIKITEIPLTILQGIAPQFKEDISKVFNFPQAIERKDSIGGTATRAVIKQIEEAKKLI